MSAPAAFLVISADGFRAVFLERATAERYAARVRGGIVHPLFLGTRAGDAP